MPRSEPTRALPRRRKPAGVDRIADALDNRIDTISERAVNDITAEIPVYLRRGEGVRDDTRRAVTLVYRSFLDVLRSARPPNESAARALATVGADRAQQGIPLSDLLHAFRISLRTVADALWDVVDSTDADSDSALWVAESIVLWVDVISNLAAADYTRAQARLISESDERRRAFLLNVLYGGISGPAALERAEEVGWDPASEYWVARCGTANASEVPADARDAFATEISRAFVASALGDVVVLAPASPETVSRPQDLDLAATRIAGAYDLVLGLTVPGAGIDGVRRAYLDASEALDIARARGSAVAHHDEALFDRILMRDRDDLQELCDRTITPLDAYDARRGADLVETLRSYFDLGDSPTRAAEALHTHPQTIRYRLNRVNEICGLDLGIPEDRLLLLVGLRAHALLSGTDSRHHLPHEL